MKKLMIALGAVAATAVLFTAQAQENPAPEAPATSEAAEAEELEEEESSLFEVALQLDINSAYVSHNRIFSDTPNAQYDIWMQLNLPDDFGWLAVDVWANQELNKRHARNWSHGGNGGNRLGGIGEFDYEIVYGNSIGPVNLTASHLWYTYPRGVGGRSFKNSSQKFWTVGAEYDNAFVVPSVKFYWEYCHPNTQDDSFMIDFALSRGFDLTEKLSLTFTSKTTLYTPGYTKYLSDGAQKGTVFGGWDNGVALNYALTDNLSLGAHLNYLYKLDHRVRHCPGWDSYSSGDDCGRHNGLLYGGVSASLSF